MSLIRLPVSTVLFYQDDITFDNLYVPGDGEIGLDAPSELALQQSTTSIQSTESSSMCAWGDRLLFGDCHVGIPKERSFTITNHSDSETVRFQVRFC